MRRYVLAVVIAAVAAPAGAQPAPWSPERITAGWVFTPAVAIGALWDTNPTTQNEGSPTAPDAEMVGLVNPRTEIHFTGRRSKFTAGYSGTLERYQDLSELTRYNQRARVDAKYQMTPRLLFETRQQFTLTPTTDELELEGVPFSRVGSRMVTSGGGFSFDVSPRAVLKTEYLFQWVDFDRDFDRLADFRFLQGGHAHSPSAEFLYALSRRVKLGGFYGHRHMVIDAGEEVTDSHRAQGTVQFEARPGTTITGRAGMDYVALSGSTESTSGPSYGAGIAQRLRGQILLHGSYERAFMPSFGFGGLTAYRILKAGVTVPIAANRGFVSGSFSRRQTEPVILQDVLVELDSYWTNAAVGYFVSRWLRVEGFLSINQQYSSARGDVQRTRVGVQFVTSKPMRIQ